MENYINGKKQNSNDHVLRLALLRLSNGPGPKSQVEVAKHTIRNLCADVCAKQT